VKERISASDCRRKLNSGLNIGSPSSSTPVNTLRDANASARSAFAQQEFDAARVPVKVKLTVEVTSKSVAKKDEAPKVAGAVHETFAVPAPDQCAVFAKLLVVSCSASLSRMPRRSREQRPGSVAPD
jgi:hypothetical protein